MSKTAKCLNDPFGAGDASSGPSAPQDDACIWEESQEEQVPTGSMEGLSKPTSSSTSTATAEDEATKMLRTLLLSLETLPINDGTFTPKPFSGSMKDVNEVDKWLEHFNDYTKFRWLSTERTVQLFKLLLTEQTADWLRSLPQETKDDLGDLIGAFRSRFAQNELHRWQNASSMWSRDQRDNESVDEYVTIMKSMAKRVPINDEEQLKFAIIKGLKSEFKRYVLQADPKSLEEVMKAAKIAELACAATKTESNNQVADLTKQVALLIDRFSKSAVNALQPPVTRSRTPSPRRVRFDEVVREDRGSNERERAPLDRQRQTTTDNDFRYETSLFKPRSYEEIRQANRNGHTSAQGNFYPRQHIAPTTEATSRPHYRQRMDEGPERRERQCGNCGVVYFSDHVCRAFGKQCYGCGKTGHFAKVCRSKQQRTTFVNRDFRSNRQY